MKWFACLLSFYILFSTVVPCCFIDNCDEEYTEKSSTSSPQKDCNNCSPFSICANSYGFTINVESFITEPLVAYTLVLYREYNYPAQSAYSFPHFQPPRIT